MVFKTETGHKASQYDYVLFSVDPVILTIIEGDLCVLLIKRSQEPCKGQWALPGGRIDKPNCDDLKSAVRSKLKQKTGLDQPYFEQVLTEGGAQMDPRGWSLSTVYMALVNHGAVVLAENDTGEEVTWVPVTDIGRRGGMAFWHEMLIDKTLCRLRDKVGYTDLPMHFMPDQFTLHELRGAYELIMGAPFPRQSFAKRVLSACILEETSRENDGGGHRPAMRYRYKQRNKPFVFPRLLIAQQD